MVLRRSVAGATAVVLVVEAAVLGFVHLVLGRTTENQSMSIAGADPDVMSKATYALGAGMAAFLLACAVFLLVAAIRDRAPGAFARVLLISAAIVHGLLGALVVGLVGWGAFAVMMLILCLLVLSLTLYAAKGAGGAGSAASGPVEGSSGPQGGFGGPGGPEGGPRGGGAGGATGGPDGGRDGGSGGGPDRGPGVRDAAPGHPLADFGDFGRVGDVKPTSP
ncbi:hypothetical protein [Streptomyces sp. NBC_01264]|uniref:hypothetical protein n=1 Tax=Streptomyces sp. NBC_01264 TaxID=2903804 RepID=UPI00225585C4|nr:hypothetical protein [Streptomyces sp. NBC_01264]MCX4780630.1 hypothetical protein [Streptomyces sp. NBC_01264]